MNNARKKHNKQTLFALPEAGKTVLIWSQRRRQIMSMHLFLEMFDWLQSNKIKLAFHTFDLVNAWYFPRLALWWPLMTRADSKNSENTCDVYISIVAETLTAKDKWWWIWKCMQGHTWARWKQCTHAGPHITQARCEFLVRTQGFELAVHIANLLHAGLSFKLAATAAHMPWHSEMRAGPCSSFVVNTCIIFAVYDL